MKDNSPWQGIVKQLWFNFSITDAILQIQERTSSQGTFTASSVIDEVA